MVRIPMHSKPVELVLIGLCGLLSLYIAFFGHLSSNLARVLLIIAAIMHFVFYREVYLDKVELKELSLKSIIWAIPWSFTMMILIIEINS
jgi:hypothetical protein